MGEWCVFVPNLSYAGRIYLVKTMNEGVPPSNSLSFIPLTFPISIRTRKMKTLHFPPLPFPLFPLFKLSVQQDKTTAYPRMITKHQDSSSIKVCSTTQQVVNDYLRLLFLHSLVFYYILVSWNMRLTKKHNFSCGFHSKQQLALHFLIQKNNNSTFSNNLHNL